MKGFELVKEYESAIPKLKQVSEEWRPQLINALYWWYEDAAKRLYADPPNIDDLLDSDSMPPGYLESVVDTVAMTIVDENEWDSEDFESFRNAHEIIHCNFEEIYTELKEDIKMVFGSLQIFHADGLITTDENGEVDWSNEKYYHSPLQEVW